jgi:hypothetical protein
VMATRDDERWTVGIVFVLKLYVSSFWLWDRGGDFALWSDRLASDDWLQHQIHVAGGMVAIQLDVNADEGVDRLRAYSYASGRRLTSVAADSIARRLTLHA